MKYWMHEISEIQGLRNLVEVLQNIGAMSGNLQTYSVTVGTDVARILTINYYWDYMRSEMLKSIRIFKM